MKLNDTLLPPEEKLKTEGDDEEEEEEESEEEENSKEPSNKETTGEKDNLLFKKQFNVDEPKTEALHASSTAQGFKKLPTLQQPEQINNNNNNVSQANLTKFPNGDNFIQSGNMNLINFATNLANINSNPILQQLTNVPKGIVPASLGAVYNIQNNEQFHNNNIFLSQYNHSNNAKILNDLIQIQQQQQLEIIIKELIHQQQLQIIQHQNYQHLSSNNAANSSANFNPCYLLLNHQNQFQQQQNFRQNQQLMPIIFNSNTNFNEPENEKSETMASVALTSLPNFSDSDQLACICVDYGSSNSNSSSTTNIATSKDVLTENVTQKSQIFSLTKPKVIIGRKVNGNITENTNASNASPIADICIENSTLVSRQHFSLELKSTLNIVTKNTNQESSATLIYWQLYCMSKNGLFVNTRYIETGKLIKLLLNKKYTFRFPNTNIRIHFESPPYEKLILTSLFNKSNNNNHNQSQILQADKKASSTSLSSVSSLSSNSSSSNNSSTSSSPNPMHQVHASIVTQQTASANFSTSSQLNAASPGSSSTTNITTNNNNTNQTTASITHSSNKIAQILMQKQMEMLQQQHNTFKSYESTPLVKSQNFSQLNDEDSRSSGGYAFLF
jgi:hypothetical protein